MKLFNIKKFSISKGFTLIELLLVIAIMGILAAAIMTAIDPIKKINSAKDSTLKSDLGQIANAIAAYYTGNNAVTYPLMLATLIATGVDELKSLPKQQVGVVTCTDGPAVAPNGDGPGAKGGGQDYCYNGAVTTAVLWAVLPSDATKSYCWDSDSGIFKITTIPAATATACP